MTGDWQRQLAQDVFLFSLYAMGMPFVDIAMLRWNAIEGGNLTYRRQKTGAQVCVHPEPCMRRILQRWRGMNGDRLFPLVPDDAQGEEAVRLYRAALARYNRQLRQMAEQAGVRKTLSSYVARHSWATLAYDKGVAMPDISVAMGHTNAQTTKNLYRTKGSDEGWQGPIEKCWTSSTKTSPRARMDGLRKQHLLLRGVTPSNMGFELFCRQLCKGRLIRWLITGCKVTTKRKYQPNFLLKNTFSDLVFPLNRVFSYSLSIVNHHFTPFLHLLARGAEGGKPFTKLKVASWMMNPVRIKKYRNK